MDATADLKHALLRMPPRSAEIMCRVGVDGLCLEALAQRYGISTEAAAHLVFRAARDLTSALEGGERAALLPDAEEAPLAKAFGAHLGGNCASHTPHAHGDIAAQCAAIDALRANAQSIAAWRAEMEAEAIRLEAQPRSQWRRRLTVAVVLALLVWWYWHGG